LIPKRGPVEDALASPVYRYTSPVTFRAIIKQRTARRLVCFAAGLLAGAGLLLYLLAQTFPGPVTDLARYASILAAYRQEKPGYVAHFPAAIPPSATEIRFQFQPGAMQGSTFLELRYLLPPSHFAGVLSHARELKAAYTPNVDLGTYTPSRLSTDPLNAAPSPTREHIELGRGGPGLDVCGMTVDPATGEVVYWMIDD
jgi:hypothetical protein